MEGHECVQREDRHVPHLYLIGKLRMYEIHLLKVGRVSSIGECRLFLLIIHTPRKGDWDSMLCCMAKEGGAICVPEGSISSSVGPCTLVQVWKNPTLSVRASRLLVNLPSYWGIEVSRGFVIYM